MFVKLQYTTSRPLSNFLRVLADIINNTNITSVSHLLTRMNTANYHTDLTNNFDAAYSEIIRTATTDNTVAHISKPGIVSSDYYATLGHGYKFTIQQKVYNSESLYYTQLSNPGKDTVSTFRVGTTIDNSIASSSWDVTAPTYDYNANGTDLALVNDAGFPTEVKNFSTLTLYNTVWAYITPTTFVISCCNNSGSRNGFTSSLATPNYQGPLIISQYSPRDYWNTSSNGILPVVYANPNRTIGSFFRESDITTPNNTLSSTPEECLFYMYNTISGVPSATAVSWTIEYNKKTALGILSRYGDVVPLSTVNSVDAAAGYVANGSPFSTTKQARIFSSDMSKKVFPLYPISFRRNGSRGGNITDQSGIFLFHGDFAPGDEIYNDGKKYMLMPMTGNEGVSYRVAWAVPKE